MTRPLYTIASEIGEDWKDITIYGAELVDAMASLNSIEDRFIFESGYRIVGCFLEEARRWSGPKAKEIKSELKKMLY